MRMRGRSGAERAAESWKAAWSGEICCSWRKQKQMEVIFLLRCKQLVISHEDGIIEDFYLVMPIVENKNEASERNIGFAPFVWVLGCSQWKAASLLSEVWYLFDQHACLCLFTCQHRMLVFCTSELPVLLPASSLLGSSCSPPLQGPSSEEERRYVIPCCVSAKLCLAWTEPDWPNPLLVVSLKKKHHLSASSLIHQSRIQSWFWAVSKLARFQRRLKAQGMGALPGCSCNKTYKGGSRA